ncbi:ABC transporter substrate-binding protein [Xylanimonas allomyrinae]|nr:ABC transporter substrate-binding protein [Xylanimonas allomyrinae]
MTRLSRSSAATTTGTILALCLSLSACVSTNEGGPAGGGTSADGAGTSGDGACSESVLIGSAMARTGFMAPFDAPALDTARIAIDKVNADGGVNGCQIVLEEIDGETDPDKGAQIATEMIAKGARMLLVTCDYDVNAKAAQVAQSAGVLVIAPCVGDTIMGPKAGLTLGYSLGSAVPGEAAIMAEYAYEKYGPRAALLRDQTIKYTQNQCSAFQTRWQELGGEIVAAPEFTQTPEGSLAAPVTAQVAEIANVDPDVVALCSYPGGGAEAMAALRQAGVDTPTVAGFGMDGGFWLGAVPGLSDFTFVTYASVFGDDPNKEITDLLKAYEASSGQPAATSGLVTGASSIEAFAEAARRAGSFEGQALSDALETFEDVALTAGPTSFSPQLHVNVSRPMAVIEVQNGEHRFVEYRAAEKPVAE